jgi:hypothetical protein
MGKATPGLLAVFGRCHWRMQLRSKGKRMSIAIAHNLEKMWLPASEILAFYVVLSTFANSFIDRKQ